MTSDEKNVLRTHDPDAAVFFYVCTHDNKKKIYGSMLEKIVLASC